MNVIDAKDLLLIIVALVIFRIVAKFIIIYIKRMIKENEEFVDKYGRL